MAISYWWAALTSSAESSHCLALHKAELSLWCETTKKILQNAQICLLLLLKYLQSFMKCCVCFYPSPHTQKRAGELQELQHSQLTKGRWFSPCQGGNPPAIIKPTSLSLQSRSNNPWLGIKGPLRSCTTNEEWKQGKGKHPYFFQRKGSTSQLQELVSLVWCLLTQWPQGKSFQSPQQWCIKESWEKLSWRLQGSAFKHTFELAAFGEASLGWVRCTIECYVPWFPQKEQKYIPTAQWSLWGFTH